MMLRIVVKGHEPIRVHLARSSKPRRIARETICGQLTRASKTRTYRRDDQLFCLTCLSRCRYGDRVREGFYTPYTGTGLGL